VVNLPFPYIKLGDRTENFSSEKEGIKMGRFNYPEVTVIVHPWPGSALKPSSRCRGRFIKVICNTLISWLRGRKNAAFHLHGFTKAEAGCTALISGAAPFAKEL
jgi:hypothetical protein